ncbi:MAG: metallophosphoesterase family protein, partial [Acidimicrobiales bacterium]
MTANRGDPPTRRRRPVPAAGAAMAVVALLVALAAACGRSTPTSAPGAPTTTMAASLASTTTGAAATGPAEAGFLAFGDFGGGPAQGAVAAAMEAWVGAGHRADALVTTGDNVYDVAQPSLFAAQLDQPYEGLRADRPMWATLGNHDVAGGYGDEELDHLGLPPLPYAKSLPGVQILFLDAKRPDEAQAAWLDEQLSAAGPPFRVVVFHQAAWSCGLHGSTEEVGELWVPVIERHHVALVLNGHDHHYERFESAGRVTYVVSGGGGRELYPTLGRCMNEPDQKAIAVRHHFVAVEVSGRTLTLAAVGDDGTVFDRAT